MRCARSMAASPSQSVTSEPIRMPANIPRLTPAPNICGRLMPSPSTIVCLPRFPFLNGSSLIVSKRIGATLELLQSYDRGCRGPQLFEVIERALGGRKDVHDHVAVVEQYPT